MLTVGEFNDLLKTRETLIIDGALATELETRGHDLNHPLWSAKVLDEDPMSIKQVHLDYFLAGADVAITASYQASIDGLREHLGMNAEKAIGLIKRSAMLARLAVEEAYGQGVRKDRKLLVAGSVGPYGAYLADGSEYRGDYERSAEEFKGFHRPRIRALIDGGVDLLAVETMPNLEEIQAVLGLLRDEFPDAIAWLSCTLKDSKRISDGTSLNDVLDMVNSYRSNIVAFGINCVPADLVLETLQHINEHADLPLLCYPNSGELWDATSKTWKNSQREAASTEHQVQDWRKAGASLIGGCCKTGPGYIMAVSKALKDVESW